MRTTTHTEGAAPPRPLPSVERRRVPPAVSLSLEGAWAVFRDADGQELLRCAPSEAEVLRRSSSSGQPD